MRVLEQIVEDTRILTSQAAQLSRNNLASQEVALVMKADLLRSQIRPELARSELSEVPQVKFREIASERSGESSANIRERVIAARKRQQERFKDRPKITCNARMGTRELKQFCKLDDSTLEMLKFAMNDLNLSARAYDRILKVARTIADLAGSDGVKNEHVSEAIQFRSLDRQIWT